MDDLDGVGIGSPTGEGQKSNRRFGDMTAMTSTKFFLSMLCDQ